MKKKLFIGIAILAVCILIVPIPMRLKDGGSVRYRALLYEVTKYHQLDFDSQSGYNDGWGIKVLGMEVYNSIK